MATELTEAEVKTIMDDFAKQAAAKLAKPPKCETEINVHDDGDEPRWIGVDVVFVFADSSTQAEKDALKALNAFGKLVDADARMECDSENGGDEFVGLDLSIGRDDDDEREDEDEDDEEDDDSDDR